MTGEVAAEFGLHHPSPMFKSFYRYNSFKNPISASDVVHAVTAMLEMGGDESNPLLLDNSPVDEEEARGDSTRGGGDDIGGNVEEVGLIDYEYNAMVVHGMGFYRVFVSIS